MENLNQAQNEAVNSDYKKIACLAGPGSGKTRTLISRICRILLEKKTSPYDIMAVTFTNKAAHEIAERLSNSIDDRIVRKMSIGTFHSLVFRRMLRWSSEHNEIYSPSIYDEHDQRDVMDAVNIKLSCKFSKAEQSYIHRLYFQDLQTLKDPREYSFISEYYRVMKDDANATDFDMIMFDYLNKTILDPIFKQWWKNQIKYLFIDEYQDTDLIQAKIIESMDPENLFIVGDLDQSIYSWRGAKMEELKVFSDKEEVHTVFLGESFRCPPEVCAAASQLIVYNQFGYKEQITSVKDPGERIRLVLSNDEENMYENIAEIASSAQDLGILCRTNREVQSISRALTKRKIAHLALDNNKPIWEEQMVRIFLSYLRLLNNPQDKYSFRRMLEWPTRGIGRKGISDIELKGLNRGMRSVDVFEELYPEDVFFVIRNALLWDNKSTFGLLGLFEGLTSLKVGLVDSNLTHRLSTWQEFTNYVENWEKETNDVSSLEFLRHISFRDMQDKLIKENAKVKVLTVHGSKGLEFEWVIIPSVVENNFPKLRGDIEEERRLFYVAITRTAKKLFLMVPALALVYTNRRCSIKKNQWSRFIKEIHNDRFQIQEEGTFIH